MSGFLTATTLETHTHQQSDAVAASQSQSPKESPSRRSRSISRRLTGTKVHLEGSSFTIGGDDDETGKISFKNLKRVAKELGENMTDEELQEMSDEADRDGDGEINEEEFLRIMKKTSLY